MVYLESDRLIVTNDLTCRDQSDGMKINTKMSRRVFLGVAVLSITAISLRFIQSSSKSPLKREHIYLLPFSGGIEHEDVLRTKSAIELVYGVAVSVLPEVPLPQIAYYAPRNRYRAEKLLDFLGSKLPKDGTRIVGLTHSDISMTKGEVYDWGVLGLAQLGGATGVISSFRCKSGGVSLSLSDRRFSKVVVHELGHCFGLSHCATSHCLMHDVESKIATIDASSDLCTVCRNKLISKNIHVVNTGKGSLDVQLSLDSSGV